MLPQELASQYIPGATDLAALYLLVPLYTKSIGIAVHAGSQTEIIIASVISPELQGGAWVKTDGVVDNYDCTLQDRAQQLAVRTYFTSLITVNTRRRP